MNGQLTRLIFRLHLLSWHFLCILFREQILRSLLLEPDFLFGIYCRSILMRLYELGVFKTLRYSFGCTFRKVFFDSTFSRHPHDNLVFWLVLFTGHQISPPIRA